MWSVTAAAALVGCLGEPSPLLETRVLFPPGMTGAPKQLHLFVARAPRPEESAWAGGVPDAATTAEPNGYVIKWDAGIGTTVTVEVRIWFDANSNGIEDVGDAVGRMSPSPFEAHDPGGCSDRPINRTPDIQLVPVLATALPPTSGSASSNHPAP